MMFVMKRIAVVGALLSTVACSTTIEGRITKEGSATPISGARVQIGEPYGYSDTQGRYVLDVEDEDNYDVLVSAPGYHARAQELRVGDEDHLNADFALAPVKPEPVANPTPDIRVDVQSHSEAVKSPDEAKVSSGSLPSSSHREAAVLQGLLRMVTLIDNAGHDNLNLARVTTESGDGAVLAFANGVEPARVGVTAGADILVEGRYAQVAGQRVLIVERLTVNGAIRLNR